jgi:hypothetical protein
MAIYSVISDGASSPDQGASKGSRHRCVAFGVSSGVFGAHCGSGASLRLARYALSAPFVPAAYRAREAQRQTDPKPKRKGWGVGYSPVPHIFPGRKAGLVNLHLIRGGATADTGVVG